jgi:hypothetical protein
MAAKADTAALALFEGKGTKIVKPTTRDRNFYLLSRRGWSTAELAVRFSTKEPNVKAAIERYQIYRDSLANDEQDLALAEMVQRAMPKVEKVLTEAMKADRQVNVGRGQQVIMRKIADHSTRLAAVSMVKEFIETGRPKGGGIQINTQVNNPGGGPTPTVISKGFDFESHLREIREKKGLGNEVAIIDAKFDEDEDGGLAAELSEIGVELDEDEDDEEEFEDGDEEDEGEED